MITGTICNVAMPPIIDLANARVEKSIQVFRRYRPTI